MFVHYIGSKLLQNSQKSLNGTHLQNGKKKKNGHQYVFSSPCEEQTCQISYFNSQKPGRKARRCVVFFPLEPARLYSIVVGSTVAFTASICLHPGTLRGMRGAAGGLQPAAAKPPCTLTRIHVLVYILFYRLLH